MEEGGRRSGLEGGGTRMYLWVLEIIVRFGHSL